MGKNRKGKKKKTGGLDIQEDQYKSAPHSFVFQRGHVGKNVKQLVKDTRQVMEPFTARNLQVRKKNVLKDFVNVAGMLHVSHFVMFTKTDSCVYMRLCRLPRGPTLTFKVQDYSLSADVISAVKKPNLNQMQFLHHPLLVMNNFNNEDNHMKLMSTMFQNLFPSINVHKVKLNDVKRCVLVNYLSDSDAIDFRHYNIKVVPVGMTRGVKKIVQSKVPNLGKYGDISDYLNRAGYSSESEVELDGPVSEVVLPQQIKSRGNIKSAKSAVRLTELGPRLRLQLVKIEEGICNGLVLYHAFINKTDEELLHLQAIRDKKKKLKETRRNQQQTNIDKKKEDREQHKQRSLDGIKRKQELDGEDGDVEQPEIAETLVEDDDVAYYKQEVGIEPDADTFIPGAGKRKRTDATKDTDGKKMKHDKGGIKKAKFSKDSKGEVKKQKFGKDKKSGNKNDKRTDGNNNKNRRSGGKDKDGKSSRRSDSGDKNQPSKRAGMTQEQRLKDYEKKKKKLKAKKQLKKSRKR